MKANPVFLRLQAEYEGDRQDLQPERQLVATMIVLAILDVSDSSRRYLACTKTETARAAQWLEDVESTHLFSFSWCCGVLGLDPRFVLDAISQDMNGVRERLQQSRGGRYAATRVAEDAAA